MKCKILIGLLIIGMLTASNLVYGQAYTTESKSCGSCGKAVSVNSTVGMTCPHCRVRWGSENERKSTNYNYTTPSYNYDNSNSIKSTGVTSSNANLRSQPYKSSSILIVVPAYSFVSIFSKSGDWYYVGYSYYDVNNRSKNMTGYIHKSLIK